MNWYMGLDASTQSLSAVVVDPEQSRIVGDLSVDFNELPEYKCASGVLENSDPLVKHSDPLLWVAALEKLFSQLRPSGIAPERIAAISGSGQQHGTVYLLDSFRELDGWHSDRLLVEQVRQMLARPTAPIWMDSSTSVECAEITRAAGGVEYVQQTTGSPAIERFSGPQIRKFHKNHPEMYEATGIIHLVSSFMGSLLAGRSIPIDYGDGAGMNLMNLERENWDRQMIEATAPGLADKLPPLRPSSTRVGKIAAYFVDKFGFSPETELLAWSGDNPNSLIGVGGWRPGVAVISLGTSHTYFAAMHTPTVDPDGYGHVFGNPAGGFMSLICFKNGALAQEAVRDQARIDWRQFDQCLRDTPAGNHGNLMLPYFVPEITPLVFRASSVYRGTPEFEAGNDTPARVRAVVEAQALRLRLHSSWIETEPGELRVTGGAAKSTEVCQVLADVFGTRVERLETGNSAGLGAALRAAQGMGVDNWRGLAATFCKPASGQTVEPIPEHVAVYRKMLPTFAEFAK